MAETTLTISSKNYSSWSMRGWLMMKLAGVSFTEIAVDSNNMDARAELLLLTPSILVPCLIHGQIKVWDTMAIGEYLNELAPQAELLPSDLTHRAHCRSVCGEMHSGFSSLRASLPMNIKARFTKFKVWSRALRDIERVLFIWRDCLATYKGPYLFGKFPTLADAMFAPVVMRFVTYDIPLDTICEQYSQQVLSIPAVQEWVAAAAIEPDHIDELEVEF